MRIRNGTLAPQQIMIQRTEHTMASLSLQKVEDRLIEASLIIAAVTSVALNIVGVDVKWYIPGIFLALYGIFRMLEDMHERAPGIKTFFYRNKAEFYAATQKQLRTAQSHIWVTYTGADPPPGSDSAEAGSYFQYTVEWARRHPDCEFRRVVGAADSGPMAAWLGRHRQDTESIKNYKVRVVPSQGRIDEIGVAIIDDKMVTLAISGDGSSMTGHSLETPEAIRAFREYYIQKWENAESLDEYIQRISSIGGSDTHQ
jgi:hypothetical protein